MNDLHEDTEAQPPLSKSKSRKKWYFLIGLIVLIIAASTPWLMMPGEAVVLGVNYSKGEKMTYEIDMKMKAMGQTSSYTTTYRIEILDEENGTYTMRSTYDLPNQTFSITVRINETGHIVEYLDVPPEFQQTTSSLNFMPGNGFYFSKDEARVGDSWQIPIDIQTEGFNLTGSANIKITETRRITMPAGTYDVFKLKFTRSEYTITYEPPPELNTTKPIEIDTTMKGYVYFEKGTCRLVEAKFEQTTSMSMMGQTMSMTMTLDVKLTEHTK